MTKPSAGTEIGVFAWRREEAGTIVVCVEEADTGLGGQWNEPPRNVGAVGGQATFRRKLSHTEHI